MAKTNIKKTIQSTILALFIVGMPLGSWYYLQTGFNYHKQLMGELHDYGQLPALLVITQNRDTVNLQDFRGKLIVADFFGDNSESKEQIIKYLQELWGQFHDQPDLVFLSHSLDPASTSCQELMDLATDNKLEEPQIYFLKTKDNAETSQLLGQVYQTPQFSEKKTEGKLSRTVGSRNLPDDYPYFVLVDTSLTIRNYYQVNDHESVSRMVEHLAILLPREEKPKAEIQREKEK